MQMIDTSPKPFLFWLDRYLVDVKCPLVTIEEGGCVGRAGVWTASSTRS